MTTTSTEYIHVARSERRAVDRFAASFEIELKSHGARRATAIDASRNGLLVLSDQLLPLKEPLMLAVQLDDGPLLAMAVVVRHTFVNGSRALGLQLLALPRHLEGRWTRALGRLKERSSSSPPSLSEGERLVEPALVARPTSRSSEYTFVSRTRLQRGDPDNNGARARGLNDRATIGRGGGAAQSK